MSRGLEGSRLGLRFGYVLNDNGKAGKPAIGWALLSAPPHPARLARDAAADPVAAAVQCCVDERARSGLEHISLYRYLSGDAFARSAAAREDGDFSSYTRNLVDVANRLTSLGFFVDFEDMP